MIILVRFWHKNTFLNWGFLIAIGLVLSAGLNAASYNISTIAGNGISGFSGDGNPATTAMVAFPSGTFVAVVPSQVYPAGQL